MANTAETDSDAFTEAVERAFDDAGLTDKDERFQLWCDILRLIEQGRAAKGHLVILRDETGKISVDSTG
jgi:hypothetical protein